VAGRWEIAFEACMIKTLTVPAQDSGCTVGRAAGIATSSSSVWRTKTPLAIFAVLLSKGTGFRGPLTTLGPYRALFGDAESRANPMGPASAFDLHSMSSTLASPPSRIFTPPQQHHSKQHLVLKHHRPQSSHPPSSPVLLLLSTAPLHHPLHPTGILSS
jgi:hypothetical protein